MSGNAMQKARAALATLPRCGAYCRTTGKLCQTVAMANGRCRMHGGTNPGAPRGARHGNYKHGRRTLAAMAERRARNEALRGLRALLRALAESEE